MIPITNARKLSPGQIIYVSDMDGNWIKSKVIENRLDRYTVLIEEVGGDRPGYRWTEEWFNLENEIEFLMEE